MGLKKSCRLHLNRYFQTLLKHGNRVQLGNLIFYWIVPQQETAQALGVRISGKLAGAVQRNRVRRLLKENFRLQRNLLKNPIHLLIIVKRYDPDQWTHVSKSGATLQQFFKEHGLS